jgi:hypothetical protein
LGSADVSDASGERAAERQPACSLLALLAPPPPHVPSPISHIRPICAWEWELGGALGGVQMKIEAGRPMEVARRHRDAKTQGEAVHLI